MFKNTRSPESIFAFVFFTFAGIAFGVLGHHLENIQRYSDVYDIRQSDLIEIGICSFLVIICITAGIGMLKKVKWIILAVQVIFILIALGAALGILSSLNSLSRNPFAMLSIFAFYGGFFGFFFFALTNRTLFPWAGKSTNSLEDELLDFEHRNDLTDD